MKRFFIKNSKSGFSLIEAMAGLAVIAVGSLALMQLSQTQTKQAKISDRKNDINELKQHVEAVIKVPSLCDENFLKAFQDEVPSNTLIKEIDQEIYTTDSVSLFKVGQVFQNKIKIDKIQFGMTGAEAPTPGADPLTENSVKAEAFVRILLNLCHGDNADCDLKDQNKLIFVKKELILTTDKNSNKIKAVECSGAGSEWEDSLLGQLKNLQDQLDAQNQAMLDLENRLTAKICSLESQVNVINGNNNTNSCGETSNIITESRIFCSGCIGMSGLLKASLNLENIKVNSLKVTIIGGGGGGGGSDHDQPGGGGKGGKVIVQSINNTANLNCNIELGEGGAGGSGGYDADKGQVGKPSVLKCNGVNMIDIAITADGGDGGCAECRGSGVETGWPGDNTIEPFTNALIGRGGSGGGRREWGRNGKDGAGGGGAGDRRERGGIGGAGYVKLEWQRVP